MSISMILFNVMILVLLPFMMESALKKVKDRSSQHPKRIYWFYMFPTFIAAATLTLLLLVPGVISNAEPLMEIQQKVIALFLLSVLLFVGAVEGSRITKNLSAEKNLINKKRL
ncbi:hypothetical protein [Planococcus alpniumensis]|uniref:hypothetical protein n=1 Tax=Planococcus alpniumensis TaxID=2708345 RepID=UPI001B8A9AE4|nr:hypothetical protein [Planococcus sp. MSAK28401]